MAVDDPRTITFTLRGPIRRADLPQLCDALSTLVRRNAAVVARCDVSAVEADAAAVDVLAQIQLAARQLGCSLRFTDSSSALRELISFMGLAEILLE